MSAKTSQRAINRNSMTNLVGQYQIAKGGKLISTNLTLVVANRRKPEATKPKSYLLRITGEKSFEYVSSLYPIPETPNTFTIDYEGVNYLLVIDTTHATILGKEKGETNNPNSISIGISAVEVHSLPKSDKP